MYKAIRTGGIKLSIQADTEILSIQAIEAYANKNHISGKEASDIFHQYHVFEN